MATASSTVLTPIRRRLLATEVYDQLLARILRGQIKVGGALPSERTLAAQLGVNRNVIREGLKRLEHAGLIEIRHGGATRVLDFRRSGGLDLLLPMLSGAEANGGAVAEPQVVVRATLELRTYLACAASRLAAERRRSAHLDVLRTHVRYMNEAASRDDMLARIGEDFWREVVAAADNVAMELAWSSIRRALTDGVEMSHFSSDHFSSGHFSSGHFSSGHLLHSGPHVVEEHVLLVDAIGRRDRDTAAAVAQRITQPASHTAKKKKKRAAVKK